MNNLTIIIPTYNRYNMLLNCISSIRNIYNDVQIIVGDSSKIKNEDVLQQLKSVDKLLYVDLFKYERNLYMIFLSLLKLVKTEYVLIVEDDDQLVNQKTHYSICKLLNDFHYKVLTFSTVLVYNNKEKKFLTNSFQYSDKTKLDVPFFWNGEFQFGNTYFDTKLLIECFEQWCSCNLERIFDGSIDEAITLLAIYHSNSYFHFNDIGLQIGIAEDNVSWNNLLRTMYSSQTYIDDLAVAMNMNNAWRQQYKAIQLREIQSLCPDVQYNDVFQNTYLKCVRSNVKKQLEAGISSKDVYTYLNTLLLKYQQIKKYTILPLEY